MGPLKKKFPIIGSEPIVIKSKQIRWVKNFVVDVFHSTTVRPVRVTVLQLSTNYIQCQSAMIALLNSGRRLNMIVGHYPRSMTISVKWSETICLCRINISREPTRSYF